jgi:hypothetical protein
MSFVRREITFTVTLGQGRTFAGGGNQATFSGLRVSCYIEKFGAPAFNTAVIRVFGMSPSHMNSIATHWEPYPKYNNNLISIQAGDASGMANVFNGGIRTAWANLQPSPEGFFEMTAYTSYYEQLVAAPSSSYGASTPAAQILATLAKQMGFAFENNGVTGVVATAYLWGSPRVQAQQIADAVGAQLYYDDTTNPVTLVACAQGSHRQGPVPLISKDTGLVGYPRYTGSWLGFKTLFNPQIRFLGQIQMQSIVPPANGNWTINKLTYDLESRVFGGAWFCECEAFVAGTQ